MRPAVRGGILEASHPLPAPSPSGGALPLCWVRYRTCGWVQSPRPPHRHPAAPQRGGALAAGPGGTQAARCRTASVVRALIRSSCDTLLFDWLQWPRRSYRSLHYTPVHGRTSAGADARAGGNKGGETASVVREQGLPASSPPPAMAPEGCWRHRPPPGSLGFSLGFVSRENSV